MSKLFHRAARNARRHRVVAALLGVLVVFGTAATVYAATSPDFSFTSPTPSQTIGSGASANYVLAVTPSNGFSGSVKLTAASLPKGMGASWSIGGTTTSGTTATMTVPAGSTATQNATLTISGGQPTAGSYSPTVTATSGSLSHSITLSLTVVNQNTADFTLSVSPANVTPVAGSSNPTTTVSIARANWTGSVNLGPVTGLPAGATATFGSATTLATTGSTATLTVSTTPWTTPPGVYTLVVPGSAVLSGKSSTTNYASFTLTVPQPGNFTISGNLASPLTLGLGGNQSLNLAITNPYSTPLTLTNLVVTLTSVTQTAAGKAAGTCNQTGTTLAPNFQINNLASSYSVTVPANSTKTLSQLNAQEPSVTWLDQKWPQNGCLGAALVFNYTANGQY